MSRLHALFSGSSLAALADRSLEVMFVVGVTSLVAGAAVWVADLFFHRLYRAFGNMKPERSAQRAKTLATIARSTTKSLIIVSAVLIGLAMVGINLTPVFASAGIIGLAVGFGAQNLIKDFLSGLFIVLEDQFGVGDIVSVGDKSGVVEAMNLRITRLRSLDGDLITIPNGTISIVANQSRGWARAVVDVGVSLQGNVDRAMEVMAEEAKKLHCEWPDKILEEPVLLGVNEFQGTRISLRLLAKTAPLEQWAVARELRRRIKNAFDLNGIEIPPQLGTLN